MLVARAEPHAHTWRVACQDWNCPLYLLIAVCILFSLAFGVALYFLLRARQRLIRLETDMAALAHDLGHANEELAVLLAEAGGSRIIVEIINPMTLARERSRLAGSLVGLAPGLIRRKVYATVARQMKTQLAEQGVDVHMDIFHPSHK